MEETRARATRLLLDVRARYRARSSTVDDALMDYLMQRLDASAVGTRWPSVATVAKAHGVNYFTLRNRLSRLATPAVPRHDVRNEHGRFTHATKQANGDGTGATTGESGRPQSHD